MWELLESRVLFDSVGGLNHTTAMLSQAVGFSDAAVVVGHDALFVGGFEQDAARKLHGTTRVDIYHADTGPL